MYEEFKNSVVYVITPLGHFIGEFKEASNDGIVLSNPVQIVMTQKEFNGNIVNVPTPVSMKMSTFFIRTESLGIGVAPKEIQDIYYQIRAQESGITIPSEQVKENIIKLNEN